MGIVGAGLHSGNCPIGGLYIYIHCSSIKTTVHFTFYRSYYISTATRGSPPRGIKNVRDSSCGFLTGFFLVLSTGLGGLAAGPRTLILQGRLMGYFNNPPRMHCFFAFSFMRSETFSPCLIQKHFKISYYIES
jgi:hypothetical protein